MSWLGKVMGRRQGPPRDVALELVRTWPFPPGMIARALAPYHGTVHVDDNLVGWVDQGLRQLYSAAVLSPKVAMPSQLVDAAWHAHITYTHDYQRFCEMVFGRFLHHTPETVMSPAALAENRSGSLQRTWQGACLHAGLDPATPSAPALFAVDSVAGFPGASRWTGSCGTDPCAAPTGTRCMRHEVAAAADANAAYAGGCGGHTGGGHAGDGCGGDGCGGGCGGD